jgi:Cof subfamily protein (haloacid dehalogenase superfamily)
MSDKTLFVSDLDGTLLQSNQTLSKYTVNTLNRLIAEVMIFSYATARSYATSSIVTAGLDAKIPVIVYNGTFVLENGTKRRLLSHFFSDEEAKEIVQIMISGGVYPIVYSYVDGAEKYFYCPKLISEETEAFLKTRRGDGRENEVDGAEQLCVGDVFHYSCIGRAETLLPIYEKLKDRFPSVYYKEIYSGDQWLEVHPTGVSKANAVLELKKLMGCDRVICFGDGKNDSSMFEISDECYAVANAERELKEIATAIIDENNEDGVAKWLEQRFGK